MRQRAQARQREKQTERESLFQLQAACGFEEGKLTLALRGEVAMPLQVGGLAREGAEN